MQREYTIIVDKSGSMDWPSRGDLGQRLLGFFGARSSRWDEARKALSHIAPNVTASDPDGVTVYFFSNNFTMADNVRTTEDVTRLFRKETPCGGTDLTKVLRAAFKRHINQGGKEETMLVITDGRPNDQATVKSAIIEMANKIQRDEELSITFIQVGDDKGATAFLDELDDGLEGSGAKFDIVDTVTTAEMRGMTFSSFIQKSIMD